MRTPHILDTRFRRILEMKKSVNNSRSVIDKFTSDIRRIVFKVSIGNIFMELSLMECFISIKPVSYVHPLVSSMRFSSWYPLRFVTSKACSFTTMYSLIYRFVFALAWDANRYVRYLEYFEEEGENMMLMHWRCIFSLVPFSAKK